MKKIVIGLATFFYTICYPYQYPRPIKDYFSQRGQDKFLNEEIFKGKKHGFFVEVGAHDGISFSNSYFFEARLGWTGLCVEPNPDIFKKLSENRQCICEQTGVSDTHGHMIFLKCTGYMLEMYSGLLTSYDPRHLERIDREIAQYGGSKELITVPCTTLREMFDKHGISHIDFLSVDIEGGEEKALMGIDFALVTIDMIVVENNFEESKVRNYLTQKGYEQITRIGKDDIYQRKDYK